MYNERMTPLSSQKMPQDIRSFMPHVATLFCYHPTLANAKEQHPSVDSFGVDRSKDPGAGAFTYLTNVEVRATKGIELGDEIFSSYYEESQLLEMGEDIPLPQNYAQADLIINETIKYLSTEDTLNVTKFWDFVRAISTQRTREALTKEIESLSNLVKLQEVGSAQSVLEPWSRSLSWLQENGICLDNLYGNKSKIIGAGQGSFASSMFLKGDILVTSPVVHVANKEYLSMKNDRQRKAKNYQLLLNYCFGHARSSVLLCPYAGLTSLINHSDSPNVEVRWSSHQYHQTQWLKEPPEFLMKQRKTGLFFDYVALHNIEPHEEIVIDYGMQWRKEWEHHVSSWVPPEKPDDYVYSFIMNRSPQPIKTTAERLSDPFPENVMTVCQYCPDEEDGHHHNENNGLKWNQANGTCFSPCSVTRREHHGDTVDYTALILNGPSVSSGAIHVPFLVSHIPREAIKFVDRPGFSDQQMPNAFRHWIGLPEDMLPLAWTERSTPQEDNVGNGAASCIQKYA